MKPRPFIALVASGLAIGFLMGSRCMPSGTSGEPKKTADAGNPSESWTTLTGILGPDGEPCTAQSGEQEGGRFLHLDHKIGPPDPRDRAEQEPVDRVELFTHFEPQSSAARKAEQEAADERVMRFEGKKVSLTGYLSMSFASTQCKGLILFVKWEDSKLLSD